MTRQRLFQSVITAAAAGAALVLASCGGAPYPTPSEEPPPPPPPVADLYGEPLPPPPPEPYEPPPPYAVAEAPAPRAPVIIAMAPIPNPPETTPAPRRSAPRAAPRTAQSQPATTRVQPAPRAQPAAPRTQPAPRPQATAPAAPATRAAPTPQVKATPPAQVKPAPSPTLKQAQPVPPLKAPATPTETGPNSPLGDRSTRLAALETALSDWIGDNAKLTTPDSFTANEPATVTLTIPAEFGQVLNDEAARNDLADAAATANVTAMLSGDGFAVTPDQSQSLPLTQGQPTEFQWTVTPQGAQTGQLRADVGADLLGAGSDTLSLGSVTGGGGFHLPDLGNRVYGIGILALIAIIIIAFLARGRSSPSRSASARRDSRRARSGSRPMTLSESEA